MFNRSTQEANISQIVRIITEIKQSIYKVVYLMMKQGEESLYFSLFLSLIQFFQIEYLAFGPKILQAWQSNSTASRLNEFLKYFVISAHLYNQEFNLYITIFYIAFGLVIISYVLFIIFAFTFKVAILPLLILKRIIHLFLTIAFVPFMLLFFGLFSCKTDISGKSLWNYNRNVECWSDQHQVHGIFAIVIIILFQIITSTMCLIFFESKSVYSNAYACRSGRPYSQFHINVLIQIMSYQLLEFPRFYTLLLLIYFGTSFFLFYQIHTEKPFYNKTMQKFWSIITAVNFWTTLMELFAYFLEGKFFQDVIFGWIGGIPLIIFIVINQTILEVDLLSSNINRAMSGQQIVILCEYLLVILDKNDQHSILILDAFLEIHKQTCYRNDCILKIKKNLNEKNKQTLQENERYQLIIELISQIYYDGIKQFPQDVFLRLNYSYFLIDRLKLKQQALSELQQAELNGPSFDHEFIIYRYKRIMEDDLQEQQQENINQVDLVTELAFQTQSKQLVQQIEKTSLIFIDFWTQLQEEIPDIGKIQNLGFKILDSTNQVQESWNRLKRLNQRALKLNRLIGKYYTQILNDEETGQKLIQQSRINQNDKFKAIDQEEIQNEQLPTLTILTDIDKLGQISNVNKAACSLLGYSKTDLINRKLSLIQPDLFAKYHDHFLENYLEKFSDYTQNSKEKSVFVKNKQGYIIPCFLNIRMIQTLNSGVFMCGTLKQEVFHRPISIFICQVNGIIENISSSCIRMFGLEIKTIQIRPINILDVFPDLFDRKEEFLSKSGGIIIYTLGTRQRNSTSHASFQDLEIENSQIDDKQQQKEIYFQCYLQEIKFTCIEDEIILNKIQGYVIKLEKVKKHEKSELMMKHKTIINPFQFKLNSFNNQEVKFILEYINGQESQEVTIKVDQSILWEDQTKISQIIENQQQLNETQQNLGDGIRTVRLIGDKIIDIDEQKSEELEDENIQSVFQQNENIDEDKIKEKETINLYKSKNQLEYLLNNSKIPRTTKNFRIAINIISLFLTLIVFLEYFINDNLIKNLYDSLPLISLNNIRLSTSMGIQSIIQDLRALNYDQYPLLKDQYYGYLQVEQKFRKWLDIELIQLINLQKELTLINVDISQLYPDAATLYQEENVIMTTIEGNSQNYTYNEAIQSIIAKSLTINSSSLQDFNNQNGDIYYVEFNIFGSITQNLYNSAFYFYYVLLIRAEELDHSILAFLITSSILLFIELLLVMLFFIKIQVVNQDVLLLFLDLNQKKIKQIYLKCENFITSLQIGDEDDDDFQSEQDENNDKENQEKDDIENMLSRKKRKKFKNSNQNFKHLVLAFIIISIIFCAYFVSIYVVIQDTTQNAIDLVPMFNQTSFSECYYRYSDNVLRKSFEDQDYLFIGGLKNILDYLIIVLYNLDAAIHQLHSENANLLSDTYLNIFNDIFILSPCDYIPIIDYEIDTDTCLQFNDGVLKQGLSIGMAKYFESFRQILNEYNNFNSSEIKEQTYNISNDIRLNYMMNLMNKNQAYNMRLMQERYIKAAYSYLNQALIDSLNQEEQSFRKFKVAIFISCILFLFFVYFIIWIPIIFRLLGDLRKNRLMLTLIPLSIIHKTASIRYYIRKIINH